MRNLLVTFFTLVSVLTVAQSKGTISGKIQDQDMGLEPLPFVSVYDSTNNSVGTTSDFDGNYSIQLTAGVHTLVFDFVGYETVKKQVTVKAGATQNITIVMKSVADALDAVVLTAVINKESEEALMEVQKDAVEIVTAIGAEELSKKGVGDVATAVTKAAGVTKQEGGSGSIFVRGLGDRYNVTTLNGLPLPSNNPSNKNISLDIFSTDIVEYVGISKTFESQNYADFGGANININAKKFSGTPYAKIGLGLGANSNVIGLDNFYLQDGPSYFGFKTVERPSNPLSPNYSTSWDRQTRKNTLNNSVSLSGGKKFDLGEAGKINAFITGSFDADNKYVEGVSRGNISAQGFINSDFNKKSYKYGTNTTVMGTADYKINQQNSILFTTLFLNSTSQEYSEYEGTNQDFDGGVNSTDFSGFIKRGTFDKTQLIVNQLVGKHNLNEKLDIDWAVGYSLLNNVIPDRMQNTFVPSRDGSDNYTFYVNSSIHNHRFFQDLNENEFSTNLSASYKFASDEEDYKGKFTVGYSGRFKSIDFVSNQYSFFPKENKFNFSKQDIHNVDSFFNPSMFNGSDVVRAINNSYEGSLFVNSLFLSLQYKLTPRLTTILGTRIESVSQLIDYKTSLQPAGDSSDFTALKVLPSLISKFKLNDKQNLKLAFSQTYTLPQFKEKVKMLFEEVNQAYIGNPDLYESTNYNLDLGWELFPGNGELVSVTTFGKIIQNPINAVFISPSTDISYVNSGDVAKAIGVEFELRKNLFVVENEDLLQTKLSFGLNASYIYHDQELDSEKVKRENEISADFTFENSRLAGASDVLANADVSFFREISENKDLTATLSYGYFSDKLAVLGTSNRGNLVDKSINQLDFILKSNLSEKLKVGLSIKNILNPVYKREQVQSDVPGSIVDDILVSSYKTGTSFSLSLGYTF
ncbi:hypothetical protein AXE80_13320 [Wenyingzhuangia fucanilytica]|uniref:TonB-dependent receptor n=1 Tax=Wenyingzhuangia fucanilytica TaxID=1790137 RepID=A0A1B1Y916_9FLAO|nr:TonB-dependent receptor [Wenyingzhuangia fucanilytica]ANW97209.1 hypothetical protein AXE80_13320 [Wenyingzhuangia fucanilytica]